ncbi:MAG: large conductance mechanosensitive channel protein MscL [Armatimonadota bacterium]
MFKEFKEFALKGNLVDLAVAFILGLSFGRLVNSLVNDVIMPPIGMLLGGMDFSSLFIDLSGGGFSSLASAKAAGASVIAYGAFINTVIDFLIVAFVLFLIVRWANKFRKLPVPPVDCPFCLSKIPASAVRCPACTSQLDTPKV